MKIDDPAPPSAPPPTSTEGGSAPPPLRPPITVYKARRPRKRRRLWVRVVFWSFFSLIVLAAAVAGGVFYFKVYEPLQQVTDISHRPDLQEAQRNIDVPLPGRAVTALILGYDHRFGDGNAPSRSDTLMLVRIDPKRKTLQLLSIPRDLRAYIPGYYVDKINAAYSLGKSKLALETVKSVLGIHINYLITIDFRGFTQIVDKFGGVWLDIDRRYYNKNIGTAATDYADIDLEPGYHHLTGPQALAYVRYRHTDSDIFRLARQQAFVREFKRKIDLYDAASKIFQLIDVVRNNVKVVGALHHTPGPTTMFGYARLIASIPRSNMFQVRIIGDQGAYNQYVNATSQEIRTAVQQFLYPSLAASQKVQQRDVGGKAVGPVHKKPRKVAPVPARRLRVAVLNGSHINLAAANGASELRGAGWKKATVGNLPASGGNAWRQDFYASVVYYTTGRAPVRAAARKLALALGDADPEAAPPQLRPLRKRFDVVLVTGSQFSGVHAAAPPPAQGVPPKTVPDVQPAPAGSNALFKAAQKRIGYPVLYPTKVPVNTVYEQPLGSPPTPDPYIYTLQNGKGKAMYVTAHSDYNSDASYIWGMQWTRWTDAPILDQPSGVRRVCGHLWKVYTNGGNIHRIAVFYGTGNRYVTWIDNSLSDGYSNATMVAVACSMRRVSG